MEVSVQVSFVTRSTLSMDIELDSTHRIPTAIQWMFPTPLAVLMFLAPESPWWLVRKGRLEQAARSVERLGRKSQVNGMEAVAMMRRVIEAESQHNPTLIELFKGTDLRRTAIVCCIYAAQNLAGNLIANQAVFFFERESEASCSLVVLLLTRYYTQRLE
jgi:SP family general alpha glucoside:H+ symporter-like MFS transporter